MAKLTKAQDEALAKVVKYQQEAGKEHVFFYKQDGIKGVDGASIYPSDGKEKIVFVPIEYIGLWQDCEYIFCGQRLSGEKTFILRQPALDLPPFPGV